MGKIKILIVDDEKLIREGLKIMLSTFDDIEVVDTAENGYKALEVCKNKDIDVVLMDIRMKDCDGVMGTRLIKEQFTKIKVIILTTFKDKEYIKNSKDYYISERKFMLEELRKISRLKVYDTDTNFVLIKLDDDEANSLKLELFEKYNILIRDASNFIGLDKSYIRVAIKSHNDNKVLIESLRKILV